MNIEKYLESEDFVKNEHGAYIYSYKHDSVNIYHLINDVKNEIKQDLLEFIRVNPKCTNQQITDYLNSL